MEATVALNRTGLRQYLDRVGDRWRLDGAYVAGPALNLEDPRVRGSEALGHQIEYRPLEFTVVLISDAFDEIPWLERVYTAGSLWDALEMGAPAAVHCFTRPEFERKREQSPWLRETIWHGLEALQLI